jgi:hypothetical protein
MRAYVHECRPTLHSFVESIDKDMQAALTLPAPEKVRDNDDLLWAINIGQRYVDSGPNNAISEAFEVFIQAAQQPQPEGVTEVTREELDKAVEGFEKKEWVGQCYSHIVFGAIRDKFPNGLKIVKQKGE